MDEINLTDDFDSVLSESRRKDDLDEIKGYFDIASLPNEETCVSSVLVSSQKVIQIRNIIDIEKFSSLDKLLMTTGYVLRFFNTVLFKRNLVSLLMITR